MKKNKIMLPAVFSLLFLGYAMGFFAPLPASWAEAPQEQDWKQEFAEVCAGTQNAMNFSAAQLQALVKRCDALQERLDELNGQEGKTERKVFAKRLKMCRDLYQFTLEYKQREQ